MGDQQSFFSAVMGELTRRKVLRTMGGYAVAVFVVLQLMDAAVEPLRLPEWFPTLVVLALILGFPIVFVLAWQFDLTGKGVRMTESARLLRPGQTLALFSFMLVATGALGLGFYQYYSGVFEDATSAPAAETQVAHDYSAPENSIAVLPFVDMSAGGDQAYLSDGMAEEILNLLAGVEGLRVAARTSSFAFRGAEEDISRIGRALNVRSVLEGSIRTSGNKIRLTAQLIDVESGFHIWSKNYDAELDDVFAMQDEVASAIAGELVDSFDGLAVSPATRPTNLAAFEAYRTGRLHWWRRSPSELQQAIQLFADALAQDAQFAPAYAGMADSYILLSMYGNLDPIEAVETALGYIDKALAIDPESAEAFAALGLARSEIDQLDAAESALRQAIRLDEDYIPARLWLSTLLGQQGRVQEQSVVLREAMTLDPLNELLVLNYAFNLDKLGRADEALEVVGSLLQIRPDSTTLLRSLSGLAMGNGRLVEAWEYASRAYDLDPDNPVIAQQLASTWIELGETDRAEALLQEAMSAAADNMDLKAQYLNLLYIEHRLEEAERVVQEMFGPEVDQLPENFQRQYHFQMGLIRMIADDMDRALAEFEQALAPDTGHLSDGDELFTLGMVAYLQQLAGNEAEANRRVEQAERWARRARINGLDGSNLYYSESILSLLRGNEEQAITSLEEAYNRGWRQAWVLDLDGRLDPLRQHAGFIALAQRIRDDVASARREVLDLAMPLVSS
ncbi:tetratricopeptide repeat protein [Marinihelvus fidelis]|uniref:Tetratricopeptide repeat protein n=1 Tax=Marinihelvus fidelis TaxID=2613842 RepID=A0A5N0TA07_9GAMM|nr:tetratricopeptide repeat protein [Marinihelvus fidelis]KAA9131284.1 tetratricopeptide repeat protein [Marinihelvus fidelis]